MPSRSRKQGERRGTHVNLVCRKLKRRLRGDVSRILSTNRILPLGSLKTTAVQRIFAGWIKKFRGKGRTFTSKFAREVCNKMRAEMGLEPEGPNAEVKQMQTLLKQARKLGIGSSKPAMDNADTQELVTLKHGLSMFELCLSEANCFVSFLLGEEWSTSLLDEQCRS